MPRPTLLIAEPEPLQAISVRKLVLETAKFNVLTAHSAHEAMELFEMFPKLSAAILVKGTGKECEDVAKNIKKSSHSVPVIVLTSTIGYRCQWADHHVSSFEPEKLLELVRRLFGDPREIDSKPKPLSQPEGQ